MKILLAVDGSACSNAAASEVARRPWPAGSEIRIISVAEPPPLTAMPETWGPPTDFYERLEREERERAGAATRQAEARLRAGPAGTLRILAEVIDGFPKEAILNEAERWGADLIVLGSHGYRGLRRLWLGSVSLAVASHARCSVEIVRGEETARTSGGPDPNPAPR